MTRRTHLVISLLAATLALGPLAGCSVSVRAGNEPAKAPAKPPPPPPPPPAPAPEPKKEEPKPEPKKEEPKPEPKKEESKVQQKGASIQLPGDIYFDTDKATFKAGSGSEEILGELRKFLADNEKTIAMIRIEGHTDNQGAADHNMELSGQRALSIKTWLEQHGVAAEKLVAVGFGQTKPVASNDKDEGRAKNRRTEFKISMTFDKKGKPKPYLGMDRLGGGKEFGAKPDDKAAKPDDKKADAKDKDKKPDDKAAKPDDKKADKPKK